MTKFRLTIHKSEIIDLCVGDAYSPGAAWCEMVNHNLTDEERKIGIANLDIDTLTGALVQVVQDDPDACMEDFGNLSASDFKIEVLGKPKVYTASKVWRAPMWRKLREDYGSKFEFTSSWLDLKEMDNSNAALCKKGWEENIRDVGRSDFLICYADQIDPISGTIVEIGAMLAKGGRVFLLGDYDWKTWQHHPNVTVQNVGRGVFTPEAEVAAILDYISIHGLS